MNTKQTMNVKCPLCEITQLSIRKIESGLLVKECPSCGGYWLSSKDYGTWLESRSLKSNNDYSDLSTSIKDTNKVMICPDCKHILIKYEVGHDAGFRLDHCGACNGVWFDKYEWESLINFNFDDKLYHIFSKEWQKQIIKDDQIKHLEKLNEAKIGKEEYKIVKQFCSWLNEHPEKSFILSYLNTHFKYKNKQKNNNKE